MKTHVAGLAFGERKDESLGVTAKVAYIVPSNVHRKYGPSIPFPEDFSGWRGEQ